MRIACARGRRIAAPTGEFLQQRSERGRAFCAFEPFIRRCAVHTRKRRRFVYAFMRKSLPPQKAYRDAAPRKKGTGIPPLSENANEAPSQSESSDAVRFLVEKPEHSVVLPPESADTTQPRRKARVQHCPDRKARRDALFGKKAARRTRISRRVPPKPLIPQDGSSRRTTLPAGRRCAKGARPAAFSGGAGSFCAMPCFRTDRPAAQSSARRPRTGTRSRLKAEKVCASIWRRMSSISRL